MDRSTQCGGRGVLDPSSNPRDSTRQPQPQAAALVAAQLHVQMALLMVEAVVFDQKALYVAIIRPWSMHVHQRIHSGVVEADAPQWALGPAWVSIGFSVMYLANGRLIYLLQYIQMAAMRDGSR